MKQYCETCIYETLPSESINLKAKETLFREGDTLNYVYKIKEGLLKMSRLHANGDEKVFDILGPLDYVALIIALKGKIEYIVSAEALTNVSLIKMKLQDVLNAYKSKPLFQQSCLNCAVTRSTQFQNSLFQISNIDVEEKILAIMQILANKFGTKNEHEIEVVLPFSKTVLANLCGIRRETLSRKLSEMQKMGIIKVKGNVYKMRHL
jgi:CRP/FNR family transcriptional regulator